MSALNLLSVIAPAAPNVPQGPSGEAASGFQSLLAALSGADALTRETAGQTDTLDPFELKVETAAATGFLAPSTPPPTPLVLPALQQSAPDSGSTGTEVRADEAAMAPSPATTSSEDDHDGVHTTTPLPVDKGPTPKTNEPQVQPRLTVVTPKTNEPQVQPRLTDISAIGGTTGDVPATLPATAAANEAATEAVRVSARIGAPPTPPPSSALPVAATSAPLRPLADRTSRPVDAPAVRTGEGLGVADPAPGAAAAATASAAPTADQPARPADFVVAAAGRETARGGETATTTTNLPPLEEGAAAQTQAASATREAVVSQLSRGAIEATAQIAAQILRRLEGRSTRFEMALTPDELGRVDVKLDIDAEGRLKARLAFDNPAAATDLKGRADELRRQLEDAGFHLSDDALEFARRDRGSSAFDRGQDSRNGSSRAFADASRLSTEIDVDQPPRWLTLSLSPSGVDMKV